MLSSEPALPVPGKKIASPDATFVAFLRHSGDLPWGTPYTSLSLDGLPFGARRFGWNAVWSPCSRFFAISEWGYAQEDERPDSYLVLIDVSRRRQCFIERVERGCIDPVFINDGLLKYSMMLPAVMERAVGYQNVNDITSWHPVSHNLPQNEFLDIGCSFASDLPTKGSVR